MLTSSTVGSGSKGSVASYKIATRAARKSAATSRNRRLHGKPLLDADLRVLAPAARFVNSQHGSQAPALQGFPRIRSVTIQANAVSCSAKGTNGSVICGDKILDSAKRVLMATDWPSITYVAPEALLVVDLLDDSDTAPRERHARPYGIQSVNSGPLAP